MWNRFAGLGRVLEIAGGRGWTAEFEATFVPFADLAAQVVDDTDFVVGYRLSAGNDLQDVDIASGRGLGDPAAAQRRPVHAIDDGNSVRWRQGHGDGVFRKTIDRSHGPWSKSVARKAFRETVQGLDAHRLGAVCHEAQRAQVQVFQARIVDLVETQLEREIGPRGHGGAKAIDRQQPALRTRQEGQRRHGIERRAVIEAAQPRADEAHVVIERQPAHEDIGGARAHRLTDRTDIGEQVGVTEHDTLGVSRAPGCVLESARRVSILQVRLARFPRWGRDRLAVLSTAASVSARPRNSVPTLIPSGTVMSMRGRHCGEFRPDGGHSPRSASAASVDRSAPESRPHRGCRRTRRRTRYP